MMWGAMAMQALGMGLEVYGTEYAVESQRKAGDYNRGLMYERAKMAEQAMDRETELATEQGRRFKASQYAAYAKSGAVPTSGTPLLVQVEQAGRMNRDILEARRNRMIEAQGLRHQGDIAKFQAYEQAKATRLAGYGRNIERGRSMFMRGMGGGAQTPQQQQPTYQNMAVNYGQTNPQMNTINQYQQNKPFQYRF